MPPLSRAPLTSSLPQPHDLERDVCRELLGHTELRFSTLVVRRLGQGTVCLEGIVHMDDDATTDVESIVHQVAGVSSVLNHLLVHPERDPAFGESRRICRTPK